MLYKKERKKILQILEDLKFYRLIDPGGGDLSIRCGKDRFIITPTGSAFRRWRIKEKDLVVLDLNCKIVEKGQFLGPVESPLIAEIYKQFPACNACIHSHAKYSLTFASQNQPVPSVINLMDTLGEVPCFYADDLKIKRAVRAGKIKVEVPEGMVQRPDVAPIFLHHIIPQLKEKLTPRKKELYKHGLAFTVFKHGLFVFARNIDEAFENLMRVEASARTAIYMKMLGAKIKS